MSRRFGSWLTVSVFLLAACGGGGGGGSSGGGSSSNSSTGGGGSSGGGTPMAIEWIDNTQVRVTIAIIDPLDEFARPVPWPRGTGMPFTLTVENVSGSPVTFSALKDPWHNVTVVDSGGAALWFLVVTGSWGPLDVTLQPSEKVEWNGTYPALDPAGDYQMMVSFSTNDLVLPQTLQIPFTLQ
jgi:hypothetical protein